MSLRTVSLVKQNAISHWHHSSSNPPHSPPVPIGQQVNPPAWKRQKSSTSSGRHNSCVCCECVCPCFLCVGCERKAFVLQASSWRAQPERRLWLWGIAETKRHPTISFVLPLTIPTSNNSAVNATVIICWLQFQPIAVRGNNQVKTKLMNIDSNRIDTRGSAYCKKGLQLSRNSHNNLRTMAGMKGSMLCFQRSSCLVSVLLLLIGSFTPAYAQEEETSLPSRFGPNGNLSPGKAQPPPPPRNPYTTGGGCLFSKGLTNKLRVCNSEDVLPDSIEQGYCRLPDKGLEYQEM